jgi:hypothetical protein
MTAVAISMVAVVVAAEPKTSERMSDTTGREERSMEIPPKTDRRMDS